MAYQDPEEEMNKTFGPPIPTSKAVKYTPVKEGQQHPVAKGGHYKLFHEHVWPKGYTPERMQEVSALDYDVSSKSDLLPGISSSDPARPQTLNRYARSIINRHFARSTVPIEHLKAIENTPMGDRLRITIEDPKKGAGAGAYFPMYHKIKLRFGENATQAFEQRTLTHEVGHAMDVNKRGIRAIEDAREVVDNPDKYSYGTSSASPTLEGIAEGYSLAHSRVTRSGKRTGGNRALVGYRAEGWDAVGNRVAYTKARNETFHEARGERMFPKKPKPQSPDAGPAQPGLFD